VDRVQVGDADGERVEGERGGIKEECRGRQEEHSE